MMKTLNSMIGGIREMYLYRHEPENASVLATVCWNIVLILGVMLVVASLISGGFFLVTAFDSIYLQDANPLPPATSFNKTQLKIALDGFDTRHANYEVLKTASMQVADPSK